MQHFATLKKDTNRKPGRRSRDCHIDTNWHRLTSNNKDVVLPNAHCPAA